ncbi:hypothetical protein QA601_09990 [Chitinispirillales bacterium ANBcel5]|uniref:hypothetical protein n=1 Tax=Cellulosispirillum alkaliphilum TaxID=3039283 RepID=UPI002A55BE10|nr:hypothetical protein [Chitinispirillales bacterium ANBcel5]
MNFFPPGRHICPGSDEPDSIRGEKRDGTQITPSGYYIDSANGLYVGSLAGLAKKEHRNRCFIKQSCSRWYSVI